MPTTSIANGLTNPYFINEVRRILRDQAAWFTDSIPTDGTNGIVSSAGAKPFRLQRAPIVTSGATIAAPSPTNGGITTWLVTYNFTDVAPTVSTVVSDGGAGGTLAAGVYQVMITYSYIGGETTSSPLTGGTGLVTIAANHLITVWNSKCGYSRELLLASFDGSGKRWGVRCKSDAHWRFNISPND